jgi:agmatine/peptidylarginine deiminase
VTFDPFRTMAIERVRPGWVAILLLSCGVHCGTPSGKPPAAAHERASELAAAAALESSRVEGDGDVELDEGDIDDAELDDGDIDPEGLDAAGGEATDGSGRGQMPQRLPGAVAPQVNAQWLRAGRPFEDTLRGDWDTPSALMVVYNSTWKRALGRLLSIAHRDLPVYVLATPKDAGSREFGRWLRGMPFAGLVSIDLDTPWIRDYGPLEVVRPRGISWLDLSYAPDDRPYDDAVPTLLGEVFETSNEREQLPLDGGGIISSGTGLCGITEASFRALGVETSDPDAVERFLEMVGCRTLALLPELPSESTGHVDMVAQFLSPDVVAIAVPAKDSPRRVRQALARARESLELAAEAHGARLSFVELPIESRQDRFYSYVNGLRTPSHYFVPSYSNLSRKLEREVQRRLSAALDGVTVVGVDSDEMIESGGAIHCVTLGLKQHLVPRPLGDQPPELSSRGPEGWLALSGRALSRDPGGASLRSASRALLQSVPRHAR